MSTAGSQVSILDQGVQKVRIVAGGAVAESDSRNASVDVPATIARKSAYLHAQMKSFKGTDDECIIEIPGAAPAAVNLYVWWLEMGDTPLFLHDFAGPVAQPQHSLMWKECFDLVQAHLLSSRVNEPGFQQYILTQLNQWLSPMQDPDLDLLDYLWRNEEQSVSNELLCFVMSHMFHMKQQSARLLVKWMRRLMQVERKMDRMEDRTRISKSQGVDDDSLILLKSDSEPLYRVVDVEQDTVAPHTRNSSATKWDALPKPISRDVTIATPLETSVSSDRATREKSSDGAPRSITSSPRLPTADARGPKRVEDSAAEQQYPARSRKRQSEPLSHQKELRDLPPALKIHPKALASIISAEGKAELEMERNFSLRKSTSPHLHPSIRRGLSRNNMFPKQGRFISKQQDDHLESRRLHEERLFTSDSLNMPVITDPSLHSLDFWTDPDDVPGPDFFNVPVEIPSKSARPVESARIHPGVPQYGVPTAKQFVQSFRLTRTPTPRRRSTRSWSVASIRPHEKGTFIRQGSVTEKPGRGLISRKPVSKAGMDFLGLYTDGDIIKRIISLNSRPTKSTSSTDRKEMHEREEEFDWNVQARRPGTA